MQILFLLKEKQQIIIFILDYIQNICIPEMFLKIQADLYVLRLELSIASIIKRQRVWSLLMIYGHESSQLRKPNSLLHIPL